MAYQAESEKCSVGWEARGNFSSQCQSNTETRLLGLETKAEACEELRQIHELARVLVQCLLHLDDVSAQNEDDDQTYMLKELAVFLGRVIDERQCRVKHVDGLVRSRGFLLVVVEIEEVLVVLDLVVQLGV
jgi:hypothetical protein